VRRLASIARRPSLVASVVRANRSMGAVRRLYMEYPETPVALRSWIARSEHLRREVFR
jgi:hypothetical protein